jgi:hypothetical protein
VSFQAPKVWSAVASTASLRRRMRRPASAALTRCGTTRSTTAWSRAWSTRCSLRKTSRCVTAGRRTYVRRRQRGDRQAHRGLREGSCPAMSRTRDCEALARRKEGAPHVGRSLHYVPSALAAARNRRVGSLGGDRDLLSPASRSDPVSRRVSPHVALPQVTTNDDQDHQVSQG